MAEVCSSDTLVSTCKSTRRYNPENQHRHLHRWENLECHITHSIPFWSSNLDSSVAQLYMLFMCFFFCVDRNSVLGSRLCQAQLPGNIYEDCELLGLDSRANRRRMHVPAPIMTEQPNIVIHSTWFSPSSMFTFIYFRVAFGISAQL
jgi:hypothetical protein